MSVLVLAYLSPLAQRSFVDLFGATFISLLSSSHAVDLRIAQRNLCNAVATISQSPTA